MPKYADCRRNASIALGNVKLIILGIYMFGLRKMNDRMREEEKTPAHIYCQPCLLKIKIYTVNHFDILKEM